jgi:transcriptional regulator with XRE-family HTH domain
VRDHSGVDRSTLRARASERIKRIAWSRGISLFRLAALADVGSAQLYRVVRGESTPSKAWLEKVAKALGVSPSDLVGTEVLPLDESTRVATLRATMQNTTDKRDTMLRVRMNDTDVARLEALAKHYEIPVSAVVRLLARERVASLSLPVVDAPKTKRGKR